MQVADWARTATRRADSWRIIWAPVGPSPRLPGITWPSLACDAELAHERGGVDEPPMLTDQPVVGELAEISVVDQERPAGGRDAHELALVGAADRGKGATRSLPATVSSVVNRRSGNALINTV